MSAPEFSRPERIDTIGERAHSVMIVADAAERAALAQRFALVALDALSATFTVQRDARGILVAGQVTADVVQACVVTDDALATRVDEAVALRFVAEDAATLPDEIELADDALDTIGYVGSAIDLGEAAAETVALALDPFPRGPRAAAMLRDAGVIGEEEAGPFGALAALAALKDKLKG